jgi:hypothetical protein
LQVHEVNVQSSARLPFALTCPPNWQLGKLDPLDVAYFPFQLQLQFSFYMHTWMVLNSVLHYFWSFLKHPIKIKIGYIHIIMN